MFVKEIPSRDQNKKVLKELYYGFLVIVPAHHLREMLELVTVDQKDKVYKGIIQ